MTEALAYLSGGALLLWILDKALGSILEHYCQELWAKLVGRHYIEVEEQIAEAQGALHEMDEKINYLIELLKKSAAASGIETKSGEHFGQQSHVGPLAHSADMIVDGHAQQGDSGGSAGG